jgi:tetratricopeptide (TPR) repeat protein
MLEPVALRSCFVCALAVFAAACGAPSFQWIEVRSQHFVLKTDAGATRAEELVQDLERSYAAVRTCVNPGGASEPPGVTHAVAFDDVEDYRKVARPGAGAFFARRRTLLEATATIVFPANSAIGARSREEILQHELTHRFVATYMPKVPLWLNEGLAEFVSTARVDGDNVVMGEPPSVHWLSPSGWMVDRQPLVRIAPDPASVRSAVSGRLWSRGYLGAWMLVHVMVLGESRHRAALEGYLRDLRSGSASAETLSERWFDDETLAEIDAAYLAFQTRTSTMTQAVALSAPPTLEVVARRSVPPAEMLAVHGRLWATDPLGTRSLEDANRAISIDPRSPEGYLLRANVLSASPDRRSAINDLRTALKLAPEDPRLVRGLGIALLWSEGPTTEVKGLVERVRLRSTSAQDFAFLSSWELFSKHPERALELAKRAIALDAYCLHCRELAADAAFRLRNYQEAIRWQRQAVNIAAENASSKSIERLSRFEKAAASPPPLPAQRSSEEAEGVSTVIRARRRDIEACYHAGRARDPNLRGKIVVRFVVAADGTVSDARDGGSDLPDSGVVACVADLVRTLKFTAPKKAPRTASLVFTFPRKKPSEAQDKESAPAP